MFRINNNDFKILNYYKTFLTHLDDVLENVPRKDMYFKDYIRNISLDLLNNILMASYSDNKKEYFTSIKGNIATLDFLLDRLFDKRYASEKAIYKISLELVEINKMTTRWINNGS